MKIEINDNITNVEVKFNDIWSLDVTLAKIIAPCLKLFKEKHDSYPFTEFSDSSEQFYDGQDTNETGDYSPKRWNWILDEMIWTFECIAQDDDYEDEERERVTNGLRLFGKYYDDLWL